MGKKFRHLTEDQRQLAWKLYYTDRVSSEEIARQFGVSGPAIRGTLRRLGGEIRSAEDAHRTKPLNEAAFDALTPEVCYWLGALMTDGSVCPDKTGQSSPRVELTWKAEDVEHLKTFGEFMGGGERLTRRWRKGKLYFRWDARSKVLADRLLTYGIYPRKTKTACPTEALKHNPDFWRGCWDGDGEVDEGNNCPALNLIGSFPLVAAFCDYFATVCPEYPLKPRPTKSTNCTVGVNLYGHGAMVLLKTLYQGASVAMPRKMQKAQEMLERFKDKNFRVLKFDIHQSATFPYIYTDLLRAQSDFVALQSLDGRSLIEPMLKGGPTGVEAHAIAKSQVGMHASHVFHECVRMKARTKGNLSPLEMWGDLALRAKIVEEAENRKHSSLRASMTANCRPAWGFSPAAAKAVYQHFGGEKQGLRILDPCAGWGDRMVAALSLPNLGRYAGYDPNTAMADVYERIRNCYGGRADARVLTSSFEDVALDEGAFDIAFTSPPYFDYEEYSDDPGQSYKRYPTAGAWRSGFLAPLVKSCFTGLDVGGVLAINISNAGRAPLVEWLMEETRGLPALSFRGTLMMKTGNFDRDYEGIYCWQKNGPG